MVNQEDGMKRFSIIALLSIGLVLTMAATAGASQVFTTSSTGVDYAVNDNGFYVSGSPITVGTAAYAGTNGSNFSLLADSTQGANDSGIVLYFNGGLTLGQLTGVTVSNYTASNNLLSVNLWLDTSGDGKFFAFSGDELTSLNGDTYVAQSNPANNGQLNVNGTTSFYDMGVDGAGGTYTLAQLQAGDVVGISASTPVAIWIGQNGTDAYTATFGSVDVSTTPEPISMIFFGTGLVAVGGYVSRRRMLRKA